MRQIEVHTKQRDYTVRVGSGLLSDLSRFVVQSGYTPAVMLVTDDTVRGLYGARAEAYLRAAGCRVSVFSIPPGEGSKTIGNYAALLEAMAEQKLSRADTVLALGGGVVGDLAGYAAATYLRGIRFLQVPTTLLAAVDSSVGGKTGVNLRAGKNLAGAFWQPSGVLLDTDTLSTLSADIYSDGAAEVVKYGMLGTRSFWDELVSGKLKSDPESIIEQCVRMKADIVSGDELDKGNRQLLNFGHTFGHAIEKVSGYAIPHGRAVAIGMVLITRTAEALGHCSGRLDALLNCLRGFGLPTECPFSPEQLLQAALLDKKISGSSITLVIPQNTEGCRLLTIPAQELTKWLTLSFDNP